MKAEPAAGETTVGCFPTVCSLHFQGFTLTVGPIYGFTGHLADGTTAPAFRVDHVVLATDRQQLPAADAAGFLLTDNQGNKTGYGQAPRSSDLAVSHPECLSDTTPGYKPDAVAIAGYPLKLPKGVCVAFVGANSPDVPTTIRIIDGFPITITPAGQ